MRLPLVLLLALAAGVSSAQFQLQSHSLLTMQGTTLTMYSTGGAMLGRMTLSRTYEDVTMIGEKLYGLNRTVNQGTGTQSFARIYQIDTQTGASWLTFTRTYNNTSRSTAPKGLATFGSNFLIETEVFGLGANDSYAQQVTPTGTFVNETLLSAISRGVDSVGTKLYSVDQLRMDNQEIKIHENRVGIGGHNISPDGVYQGVAGAGDRYWVSYKEFITSPTASLRAYDLSGGALGAFDIDAPVNGLAYVGAVPEPGTMAVLGLGAFALARKRRRR